MMTRRRKKPKTRSQSIRPHRVVNYAAPQRTETIQRSSEPDRTTSVFVISMTTQDGQEYITKVRYDLYKCYMQITGPFLGRVNSYVSVGLDGDGEIVAVSPDYLGRWLPATAVTCSR